MVDNVPSVASHLTHFKLNVASDLGLHCLPVTRLDVFRPKWLKAALLPYLFWKYNLFKINHYENTPIQIY